MNPLRLLVLLVSLPLLLGGCGEKATVEPVSEVKPVEEKQQEVKEEDKPAEPVAEVKPQLDGVNLDKLEEREGIVYLKGSDTPYTGKATSLYENGQKWSEANFKDGKEISSKLWNSKGEPVDSIEEVKK